MRPRERKGAEEARIERAGEMAAHSSKRKASFLFRA